VRPLLDDRPALHDQDHVGIADRGQPVRDDQRGAAFGQRRKTAANAIAGGLNLPKEKVIAAIEASGFDARIRPEALTLADFAKIQQALA
jgi:16S rRNA A1518/A1519 N6-dimethyltransferase RsmA/KsgA/DIM1 with predicted DNA glycosylase/AP lyase activity